MNHALHPVNEWHLNALVFMVAFLSQVSSAVYHAETFTDNLAAPYWVVFIFFLALYPAVIGGMFALVRFRDHTVIDSDSAITMVLTIVHLFGILVFVFGCYAAIYLYFNLYLGIVLFISTLGIIVWAATFAEMKRNHFQFTPLLAVCTALLFAAMICIGAYIGGDDGFSFCLLTLAFFCLLYSLMNLINVPGKRIVVYSSHMFPVYKYNVLSQSYSYNNAGAFLWLFGWFIVAIWGEFERFFGRANNWAQCASVLSFVLVPLSARMYYEFSAGWELAEARDFTTDATMTRLRDIVFAKSGPWLKYYMHLDTFSKVPLMPSRANKFLPMNFDSARGEIVMEDFPSTALKRDADAAHFKVYQMITLSFDPKNQVDALDIKKCYTSWQTALRNYNKCLRAEIEFRTVYQLNILAFARNAQSEIQRDIIAFLRKESGLETVAAVDLEDWSPNVIHSLREYALKNYGEFAARQALLDAQMSAQSKARRAFVDVASATVMPLMEQSDLDRVEGRGKAVSDPAQLIRKKNRSCSEFVFSQISLDFLSGSI